MHQKHRLNTQIFLEVEFVYRRISAQHRVRSLKKGDFVQDFSSCSETTEEAGEWMKDDEVPDQWSK